MAPILLGFILGGLMEDNLRRSLEIYDGSIAFLWERPVTMVINLITIGFLAMPVVQMIMAFRKKAKVNALDDATTD